MPELSRPSEKLVASSRERPCTVESVHSSLLSVCGFARCDVVYVLVLGTVYCQLIALRWSELK
jgi:hypothetical protein